MPPYPPYPRYPVRRRAAALFALAAAVGYPALWLGYRQGWGWLVAADSSALRAAYDVGVNHPGWVRFWDVLCAVFAPATFRVLGGLAVVGVLVQRRVRTALVVLVSVEFSGLVSQAGKDLADRPRPATALASATSSSFPSGHALAAAVGVAALLTVALPVLGRPARRVAVLVGVLVVAAVGIGRVALNVHYPSDVVAGWALGYLYFVACAWLLGPARPAQRAAPERVDRAR